jgi:hypothetical protein
MPVVVSAIEHTASLGVESQDVRGISIFFVLLSWRMYICEH